MRPLFREMSPGRPVDAGLTLQDDLPAITREAAMQRFLICLLLVAAPAVAAGQSIDPGTYVRVSTSRHLPLQGTVTSVSDDFIVVDTVRIPINSIFHLRARYRRSNAGRGAVIGGITLGALSGVALGAACSGSSGSFIDCSDSVPAAFAAGAAVGFVFGAGIGALIGAFVETDSWEQVHVDRLRVGVVPRRGGPLTLGLSLSF